MSGTHGVASVAGPEGTREGLRAIRISAVVLGAAAATQLAVVAIGHSVGLLADALDNLGDVITTVVLAIAFVAARRAADDRYTFGYQRLEDLAGVLVVLVIWASAVYAGLESFRKLTGEHEVRSVYLGMGAALFGAVSNEIVARYKMSVGRRIGSEPLVADGAHARTDALASVAAFAGLLGVRLGWPAADPVAGFAITVAIAWIAIEVSRNVLARVLDAVDPELVETIEHVAATTGGVDGVGRVQARWAGRSLYVTVTVAADPALTLAESHAIAEALHHRMIHELPFVAQVDVHVDPGEAHAPGAHPRTASHDTSHDDQDVHPAHHDHDDHAH